MYGSIKYEQLNSWKTIPIHHKILKPEYKDIKMNRVKNNRDISSIDGEIKIFGTENGVSVIDSPIKTKILSFIKNDGLKTREFISRTISY